MDITPDVICHYSFIRDLSLLPPQIQVTEENVESVVANLTQIINDISTIDDDGLESIALILEGIVEVEEPDEDVSIRLPWNWFCID